MQKRRVTRLLIAGVVLAWVLVVVWNRTQEPPEPQYGGKKLREWVEKAGETFRVADGNPLQIRQEAEDAIGHIGSNAIPFLIQWLGYEVPPWKIYLYQNAPKVFRKPFNGWIRQDNLAICASSAFAKLGPDADAAVPELILLLNDRKRRSSSGRAADALGMLGVGSLPTLLAALTNRQTEIGASIAIGISHMGTNARSAVPALTNLLNDPDPAMRRITSEVLRRIDPVAVERSSR